MNYATKIIAFHLIHMKVSCDSQYVCVRVCVCVCVCERERERERERESFIIFGGQI